MCHALAHHPGLTPARPRARPHVSPAAPSARTNEPLGQPRRLNPVALARGSHFHTAVPEPPAPARPSERGINRADPERVARQVRRQRYGRDLLRRGPAEQSDTATRTATGGGDAAPRPAGAPPRRPPTLLDFRTTSRPDRARFLATTAQYDYGRQAAPYLDVQKPHIKRLK